MHFRCAGQRNVQLIYPLPPVRFVESAGVSDKRYWFVLHASSSNSSINIFKVVLINLILHSLIFYIYLMKIHFVEFIVNINRSRSTFRFSDFDVWLSADQNMADTTSKIKHIQEHIKEHPQLILDFSNNRFEKYSQFTILFHVPFKPSLPYTLLMRQGGGNLFCFQFFIFTEFIKIARGRMLNRYRSENTSVRIWISNDVKRSNKQKQYLRVTKVTTVAVSRKSCTVVFWIG